MIIVDDHLALLALVGPVPVEIEADQLVTTYAFHYRLLRAVADDSHPGSLTGRFSDPESALRRVMLPPADRLVVLDPRQSLEQAVGVAGRHPANLLLAELLGAALLHRAKVRVSRANVGRSWPAIMRAESVDFVAVDI